MKRVLFIAPHLSTGGMPQYLLKLIQKLNDTHDVYCIEYSDISPAFVVQKNKIAAILGSKFYSLDSDKVKLFDLIDDISPDIVHLQEVPEYFMHSDIYNRLYSNTRLYNIVETSHDSSFSYTQKRVLPDYFALVSNYQKIEFSKLGVPVDLVEYDIEYKDIRVDRTAGLLKLGLDPSLTHVLIVGLFTPRKNQAEVFKYARILEKQNQPIQFHFVGNLADNFSSYWNPLISNAPTNVKIWGEREDVDSFYSCMDLFLFTSRGTDGDKETSPLVIREAIGWKIPSLIYNLPVYLDMYDKYDSIEYLDPTSIGNNLQLILFKLKVAPLPSFDIKYINEYNKIEYRSSLDIAKFRITVRDIDSNAVMWSSYYDTIYANQDYWLIPMPKSFLDLGADLSFGGFIVEMYSDDKLIHTHDIRIRTPNVDKPHLNIDNHTEPVFINYNEFFVEKIYDKYLSNNLYGIVVDVGANVGVWSSYITKYLSPNGRRILVEPNKVALSILHKSFDDDATVTIFPAALTPSDCDITLNVNTNNSTISSVTNITTFDSGYSVRGVSFKTLIYECKLDKTGIDLMKIDIESAEYELFTSMTDEDFSLVKSFLIEYHLTSDISIDNDVKPILIDKLISLGYDTTMVVAHSTGGFIYAFMPVTTQLEYIKAVQLTLNTDDNTGINRNYNNHIESQMKLLGIPYVEHNNEVYQDMPPRSKCMRPDDVVAAANTPTVRNNPGALTPAHYGCYDSFRTALLSEFDNGIEYLMVFEGDSSIQDIQVFKSTLEEALQLMDDENIDIISLGGRYDIETGNIQSHPAHKFSSSKLMSTDKIIGCQCLIFKKSDKLRHILRTEKWDAFDIYINIIRCTHNLSYGVSMQTIVTQFNGFSAIDGNAKYFKKFDII